MPGENPYVVSFSSQERSDLERGGEWEQSSSTFQEAKKRFDEEGVLAISNAVPASLVDATHTRAKHDLSILESEVAAQRQALTKDQHHRAVRVHRCDFRELVQRDGGRLDMRYRLTDPPLNSPLLSYNPIWFPLVQELLGGGEVTLLYMGVMVARNSTADDQQWHGDGDHLFKHAHSPPHCINVFVPLVDLVPSNGPTHFCPGTHRLGSFNKDTNRWPLCASKGDAILFDYRVKHKGGANSTEIDRPILYLCYSRPWFRDQGNTRSKISLISRSDSRYSKPWTARLLRGTAVSYLHKPLQQQQQEEDKDGRHQGKQNHQSEDVGTQAKRRRVEEEVDDEEQEGAGEHWPLFEMNVDLDDGVGAPGGSNTIRVHNGDVPLELAAQFVQARGLSAEFIEPLAGSIAAQMAAATSPEGK